MSSLSSPTSSSPTSSPPRDGAGGDTRPGVVLLLSAGATFIAFLDTTVVNVAFPDLAASFPTDRVPDLSWVVSSYAVLFAALLTPAGRIADALGRKKLFLSSLAGFTLASALCAAAQNLPLLITARALQGATAAGMIPAALGLLLATTPPRRLPAAIGAWGAAGSMATAAGPALGGVLVDAFGWRAVFLINVPVGVVLVLAGLRALPERTGAHRRLPDPLGTLAVTAGIALLVLGLTKGSDWGWGEASTTASVVGGAALIALALVRSARHGAPAVETALFHNATFAVSSTAAAFTGAALFAWLLSSPLFLTTVWHYSVLKAGFAVTPGALTSAVAAIAVGNRAKPHQLPAVVAVSMAAFAAASVWAYLALGTDHRFLALWLPVGLVGGAAFGGTLTALSTAAARSLPPQQFASGVGMTTTARQLGGALGVAATASVIAARGVGGPQAYRDLYLTCGALAAVAAVVGLAMARTLSKES
ncbi:DHA2 family efflux MFS transporter permease subunit [Actinacidiphila epipremni]|uniref:DHA2 family efflux MFS transporter permease subunit n=1 Tax=Actinacidiphila epipremni TaxID=2053013 RepID=A0ABX1A0T7_9ACTN|nr:DHA2 family efflux MFS transporter permease subunit [Actinacidiphila epipremni]NJP47458.1 DHA2 family efflux MFS transporter permease subunit [Actinacidiphila epipremni]